MKLQLKYLYPIPPGVQDILCLCVRKKYSELIRIRPPFNVPISLSVCLTVCLPNVCPSNFVFNLKIAIFQIFSQNLLHWYILIDGSFGGCNGLWVFHLIMRVFHFLSNNTKKYVLRNLCKDRHTIETVLLDGVILCDAIFYTPSY